MFFDEGNCRAVRLLHEASYFLEACLEKLLALEQEALSELKNENIRNKNKSGNSFKDSSKDIVGECPDLNCMPSTSSAILFKNESSCLVNTEHCEPKKISILDLEKLPPIPEYIAKRKLEAVQSNEHLKRCKCDEMMNQSDKENHVFHIKQSNIKNNQTLEHSSELRIQNIQNEDHLDKPVLNSSQGYYIFFIFMALKYW